jgi:hypothetical protein
MTSKHGQTLYVASNVRNLDMDKVNAKGKSSVSSAQRRAMMATLVKMLTSVPIVGNLIWPTNFRASGYEIFLSTFMV